MKSWTGTEKLTRGWWVNNSVDPVYCGDQRQTFVIARHIGEAAWWDGFMWQLAPPGRELVGFCVRWWDASKRAWDNDYLHPGGYCNSRRQVFATFKEAKTRYPFGWSYGSSYRIRPVTRRKREALNAAERIEYAKRELEQLATPKFTVTETGPKVYMDGAGLGHRPAGYQWQLDSVNCKWALVDRATPPAITFSDALSDQLRGCLRIGR